MSDTPKSGAGVITMLSVMMFLQFFVWGAWYRHHWHRTFMARHQWAMGGAHFAGRVHVGPIAAMI